jgi:hypothetical protein
MQVATAIDNSRQAQGLIPLSARPSSRIISGYSLKLPCKAVSLLACSLFSSFAGASASATAKGKALLELACKPLTYAFRVKGQEELQGILDKSSAMKELFCKELSALFIDPSNQCSLLSKVQASFQKFQRDLDSGLDELNDFLDDRNKVERLIHNGIMQYGSAADEWNSHTRILSLLAVEYLNNLALAVNREQISELTNLVIDQLSFFNIQNISVAE